MIRFIWLVMTVIISLPAHQNICLSSSENGIWNKFSVNSCMVTYELFFQLKHCQWVMLSCNGTCLPCFIVQYQKLPFLSNEGINFSILPPNFFWFHATTSSNTKNALNSIKKSRFYTIEASNTVKRWYVLQWLFSKHGLHVTSRAFSVVA